MKKIFVPVILCLFFIPPIFSQAIIRFRNIDWNSTQEQVEASILLPGETLIKQSNLEWVIVNYGDCSSVYVHFNSDGTLQYILISHKVSSYTDLFNQIYQLHTKVFGQPIVGDSPPDNPCQAAVWTDQEGNHLVLRLVNEVVSISFCPRRNFVSEGR